MDIEKTVPDEARALGIGVLFRLSFLFEDFNYLQVLEIMEPKVQAGKESNYEVRFGVAVMVNSFNANLHCMVYLNLHYAKKAVTIIHTLDAIPAELLLDA